MAHVLAIYAKETGEGMMFDPEEGAAGTAVESESTGPGSLSSDSPSEPSSEASSEARMEPSSETSSGAKKAGPGAHLKVIK